MNQIAKEFDISIIYTFGSNAKAVAEWLGCERFELQVSPPSDVDVGVKPCAGKALSVKEKVHLAIALEDFLFVSRVDLVVMPEVDPFLSANIIRGERLYCKDAYEADEYDLYILRRAGDLIPLERERISLIMESS